LRLRAGLAGGLVVALLAGCGGGGAVTLTGQTKPPPRSTPPALGSLDSSGAGNRFYEIYDPIGPVRGTMLLVHGGGWQDSRGGVNSARYSESTPALTLRAEGWRVVDISYTQGYRPGAKPDPLPMLRDVVAFYDQIRSAFGGPVCAYGQSAGAHLSAMLAVERPTLTCAVLDASPTDLPSLARAADSPAVGLIRHTFGSNPSTLAQWSPARDWRPTIHTSVFATFGANDPVVPPQQGDALHAVDPKANVAVLPGGTFFWLHSEVDYNSLYARDVNGLVGFLKGAMPASRDAPSAVGTDVGADCDVQPQVGQRSKLMLAGDAWHQRSSWTVGQPALIAATRGCSGSARWQDDGMSLWAWSASSSPLAQGQNAALTLDPGHPISKLAVSFRGFLARPQDWRLGLYASTSASGPVSTPVAACDRGSCTGLGLYRTSSGSLLTASGSNGNPDNSNQPPRATFTLPTGTVRVAWQLECVASGGCSVQSIAHPRSRDPMGHSAIFSIYRAETS
jgi:acetyl esterase/lipase